MIKDIAFFKSRNDEQPNIELGKKLAITKDSEVIKKIAINTLNENKAIAGDCIKVLATLASINPTLLSEYVNLFLYLLRSKNNKLVWGSMTVLSYITPLVPDKIYKRLDDVVSAYRNGGTITRDKSITVFALLCKQSEAYSDKIFPLLLHHLVMCKAKELPQHAERASIAVNQENISSFIDVISKRMNELNDIRLKRVNKLIKNLS